MSYLRGTDLGSALCFKLGMLAVPYRNKQKATSVVMKENKSRVGVNTYLKAAHYKFVHEMQTVLFVLNGV